MTVISSLISILTYFGVLMCAHLLASRMTKNMKTVVLRHLTRLPVGYFKQRGSDKLKHTIDDGAGQTETYLAYQLPDLAGVLATPATVLALPLVFNQRSGLISLTPTAVGTFFLSHMMGPRMAECMRQYQNALEDMDSEAVKYMRGISVVETLQQSIFSFKSLHDSILRCRNRAVNYTVSLRIPICAYTVSINGIPVLLIPAGTLFAGGIFRGVVYETITLDLLLYILFTPICVSMMDRTVWASENTMAARDTMNRVLDIIKEKPLPEPAVATTPLGYTVGFRDISFSYDNTGTDALSHVSLIVPQDTAAAMVGAPRSGKTALVSLIPRLSDVDGGSICTNGMDMRGIDNEELMELVSFVFQDCHLFKDSLLNNIRVAKPQATKEEVMRVVAAARCKGIIEKMSQDLDTVMRTKSIYLFDGEVQRIAPIRAIPKDVPIVLLDEATTFANSDNEYLTQQALGMLVKGETVTMIARRFSTVCHLDRTLALGQSQIAEQGRHEKLLRSGGLYAEMWKNCQASVEWKIGGEV